MSAPQVRTDGQKSDTELPSSPEQERSKTPFNWDDDGQTEADFEVSPSCWQAINGWRYVRILSIFILLLIPGIVDYVYYVAVAGVTSPFPLLQQSYTSIGGYSLMFWSLFVSVAYLAYYILYLCVYLFPNVATLVLELFFTHMPDSLEKFFEYVVDLRKYITRAIFFIALDVTFFFIFRPDINGTDGNSWQWVVFNVISSVLTVSVFMLAEKFFIQIIATNFHKVAYEERIKNVKYFGTVLQRLSRAAKKVLKQRDQILSLMEAKKVTTPSLQVHSEKKGRVSIQPVVLSASDPSSPMTPLKKAASLTQISLKRSQSLEPETDTDADKLASPKSNRSAVRKLWPFHRHKHENDAVTIHSGSSVSNLSLASDDDVSRRFARMAKELSSSFEAHNPKEAKKVARRIFEALNYETTLFLQRYAKRPSKAILSQSARPKDRDNELLYIEDLNPYFPTMEDSQAAFCLFDRDGNGSITKEEMRDAILNFYKERKVLSSSLRDVGSAVGKLDIVMTILATCFALLVILLIFGVNLQSYLVTSMSMILAATFVFGNSAKNMFEGIIFLFVTHPFDVGDRVFIDDVNLIVKELGILSTVFQKWDGQLIYMPNSVLANNKQIVNVRRSPNQIEVIEFLVDFHTPPDKINALRHKITEFLHSESREFVPRMEVQATDFAQMTTMKITLYLEHRTNWQDSGKRWQRRSRFMYFLKDTLTELDIRFKYADQEIILDKVPAEWMKM